ACWPATKLGYDPAGPRTPCRASRPPDRLLVDVSPSCPRSGATREAATAATGRSTGRRRDDAEHRPSLLQERHDAPGPTSGVPGVAPAPLPGFRGDRGG